MTYNQLLKNEPNRGSGLHNHIRITLIQGFREGKSINEMVADFASEDKAEIYRMAEWACGIAKGDPTGVKYKARPAKSKAQPAQKPVVTKFGMDTVRQYVAAGIGFKLEPLGLAPQQQALALLDALYDPDDMLLVGSNRATMVMEMSLWRARIEKYPLNGLPQIIMNPLTGEEAPCADGIKMSKRCDRAVKSFNFCLGEFDEFDGQPFSLEDQYAFWMAVPLPICALIYSGSKSIHAWIDIRSAGITCYDEWELLLRPLIYGQHLIPMGMDGSAANCSRQSRLAGHERDNGNIQTLIYLNPNPDGTPIMKSNKE